MTATYRMTCPLRNLYRRYRMWCDLRAMVRSGHLVRLPNGAYVATMAGTMHACEDDTVRQRISAHLRQQRGRS